MRKYLSLLFFSLLNIFAYSQSVDNVLPESEDKIYMAVEQQAVPEGGIKKFYSDFGAAYKAPEVPKGVTQVRLMLSFVIEKDGSFTDCKVLRDGGLPQAGAEAIRVLSIMPKWKPAVQNGQAVRSQFTLPITIQVDEGKKPFSYYMNKL